MGIRDTIRLIWGGGQAKSAARSERSFRRLRSPWSTAENLQRILGAEFIGMDSAGLISRAQAMSVPPVAKGRAILTGQIAKAPLVALDEPNGVPAQQQPRWLYRTDGPISPHHRMLWTVDDCIFTGWSLWATPRDDNGAIETGERIPVEWWEFDADGTIIVNDEPVDNDDVTLIPGPSEGFLEFATRSIRGALSLEESYVRRAAVPIPLVELHETVDNAFTDEQIDELIADYIAARKDPDGIVSFTPAGIQMNVHGEQATNLAIEGRNFAKIDVANFLNLPGSALDGSLSTASLTYSTETGKRNEIQDYSVDYWADPITARLSQDDCVPEGTRVRFDFTQNRTPDPSPTGAVTKD
ncbi:MAG: hypothetical protein QM606_05825 [Leucobacter sp.]